MIYETDLFSFSFVPNWYLQLDALAELALPEPWRFRGGSYSEKNYDTPILERYIQSIFRKQVIDYNAATDKTEQDRIILMRNEYACFHTGLYTKRYKPIYACFGRNKKLDSLLKWCFRGFADENSALLRYISPLPEKPLYSMPLQGIHYVPDWPVRVNVEHILGDPANVARLPTELQSARNLPLLLETAVELARRKVVVAPGDAVPQIYQQRLQYLLPLCLTDMETPDLAITLRPMDGYYMGYPGLSRWQDTVKRQAAARHYSETWLGRRRYLPGITSQDWAKRSFAERCALNTPIQGTAADILKLALGRLLQGLPERPWLRPLLQIHDELVFELPEARQEEAIRFVRGCMEAQPFPAFDVPILAEAAAGENFGDMAEVDG